MNVETPWLLGPSQAAGARMPSFASRLVVRANARMSTSALRESAARLARVFQKFWGAHAPSRVRVGASPTGAGLAHRTASCKLEVQACGETPQAAREARAAPTKTGEICRLAVWAAISLCFAWSSATLAAQTSVEQWGSFEISLPGPANGNPFLDVQFSARFSFGDSTTDAAGFYDGDGTFRVRFMPEKPGQWRYATRSNVPELNAKAGEFNVTKPSSNNHGPVRVQNTFHFAYAEGTPFKQIGTTCYAWIHQGDALEELTLKTLAASPFNKIRFCVFPKRYDWNTNEPALYPFDGQPPRTWDFTRFNPKFFQHLEQRIAQLRDLGIEADVILFHPYDRGHWGFDRMKPEEDDRYLRYVVSRLAAFRNIWWSLANEYDFMREKRESDWDRFFGIVQASDPYGHLRSIHNGSRLYNHTLPWVTHASLQNGSAVEDAGRAVLYRDAYRKPIVFDEVKYEGNIPRRWGNISAEELVFRFWQGTVAGAYVGHGETYLHPRDILWWSKGGVLHGESPARLAFLRRVLEDSPREGIDPIDKWQNPRIGGKAGEYYLIYFGKETPIGWPFELPKAALTDGMKFKVEILDTWNMTTTPVEGVFAIRKKDDYFFADRQARSVRLPGRPDIALRIRRVQD